MHQYVFGQEESKLNLPTHNFTSSRAVSHACTAFAWDPNLGYQEIGRSQMRRNGIALCTLGKCQGLSLHFTIWETFKVYHPTTRIPNSSSSSSSPSQKPRVKWISGTERAIIAGVKTTGKILSLKKKISKKLVGFFKKPRRPEGPQTRSWGPEGP